MYIFNVFFTRIDQNTFYDLLFCNIRVISNVFADAYWSQSYETVLKSKGVRK
jgi:hypothetical protein